MSLADFTVHFDFIAKSRPCFYFFLCFLCYFFLCFLWNDGHKRSTWQSLLNSESWGSMSKRDPDSVSYCSRRRRWASQVRFTTVRLSWSARSNWSRILPEQDKRKHPTGKVSASTVHWSNWPPTTGNVCLERRWTWEWQLCAALSFPTLAENWLAVIITPIVILGRLDPSRDSLDIFATFGRRRLHWPKHWSFGGYPCRAGPLVFGNRMFRCFSTPG